MFLKNLFEAIENKTAVLGWGRGMGHKGHMLLAKAVLHHAKENQAKPYFVVSRTSLVDPSTGQPWADRPTFTKTKDDPLTPEEKLNTYRKVFPQNAEVFSVATADATKLEQVMAKIAKDGFNKVILVVGEDQKDSMGYLKRPDKSGVAPYQQAGIQELEIISRQDTTEPSSMKDSPEYQEGPRATPMRQVLLDPSKSEKEQFAIWRRDMPDQLSDEEVLDLMRKAKQRMLAVPAAKNRKTQSEDAAGVGVIASKKQAKDPRYSMSLTKDIRPGQVEKNLKAFSLAEDDVVDEKMLPKSAFAGSKKNKLGVAGQWRNKGPKANKPAKAGDLVGDAEESVQISESVDPKVSIVFDKYNPPDKDSIDGWKVAAKTKYWLVGTNKVKKDTKNPLPHEVKLVCLQAAMPRITEHLEIVEDWLELAVKAYKKYGDIELVVCTRHDNIYKDILQKNGHEGKHGYFKFDKITRVATPYYRNDKELKKSLMDKDKTAFRRSSGVAPDKRVVAQHNRYEYFDLLEKFMIKRVPLVSLNESKLIPVDSSIELIMENLIKRLENK